MSQERFTVWLNALEARHLADLTFAEVSRALRALSSTYVERRPRLHQGAALSGTGKRAAFALFYGPLHYLLIQHIVASLPEALSGDRPLVNLGCGTGASGAAWAGMCAPVPTVMGIDRHPWTVEEAGRTYRVFGLRGSSRVGDAAKASFPERSRVVAAFVVNEIAADGREGLLARLIAHAQRGGRVLVVEPLARAVAPWWKAWERAFEAAGGRADEWRVRMPLPSIVEKLDRAAGLNHRELTGRSLWL